MASTTKIPDDLVDVGPGGYATIQPTKTEEKVAAPSDMVQVDPDYVESQVDLLNPVTKAAAVGAAARPLVKKVLGMNEQTGRQSLETYLRSQIHHKYPGLNLDALEKEVQKIYGPQARVSTMAEVQAGLNAVQGPVFGKPTVDLSPYSKNILTGKTRAGQGEMLLKSVGENINPITGQGFGAKTMRTAGRGVIGGAAGVQGASAYNRWQEGDMPGAATSGVGALGAALLTSRNPKAKRAGAILQGLSLPGQFMREEKEGYKEGGLVYLAEGGGKLGRAKTLAKSVAAKMSPGMSFGNTAPAYEQTVTNPLRNAFPGIYKRPDIIAQEAAARVAPESPALKQLFGVTRDDLYEMGKGRVGNVSGVLPGAAANPKGSRAAMDVMNPRNEQRLLDVLSEAEKYPALVKGMDPWYIMDPAYQRLEQLVGPEEAVKRYRQLNTLTGMASPGSDVLTEMNRGTAANYLATQGRFGDFVNYAGKPMGARGADFPEDLRAVMGHPYHRTAQAIPMQQYLDTGTVQMSSPKVPAYIQASGVPQTGFQTDLPVGDAHWSRAVGLADTRGAATRKGQSVIPGASVSNPEMSTLAPWWKDKIAGEIGIESVPAQARAWGAFSPQTGVESPIGAPKLEMLSMKIMEAANRLGITPEQARDMILKGEAYAGKKEGGSTTPAWQRSEGKSPSGGLNALGRASYKRETGGELKAPQPEGGSRKKSFCARMGGMKKKLTSSKTANDPDSRINKALRKWKC